MLAFSSLNSIRITHTLQLNCAGFHQSLGRHDVTAW